MLCPCAGPRSANLYGEGKAQRGVSDTIQNSTKLGNVLSNATRGSVYLRVSSTRLLGVDMWVTLTQGDKGGGMLRDLAGGAAVARQCTLSCVDEPRVVGDS